MNKKYDVIRSESLETKRGNLLDDFSMPWSDRDCPRTEFRAVWNDEALAFRFEVDDADLVLAEHDNPGEGALGSDRVELFFAADPRLSGPYYGTEMDPSGRVFDYKARHYREIDGTWSFQTLCFEGTLTPGGYVLEGRISLDELRSIGVLSGFHLVAGVYRAEFSHSEEGIVEEWIPWVNPQTETPDFHVPESFGRFELLDS